MGYVTVVDTYEDDRQDFNAVTTRQTLLTSAWTGHVKALETAVERFKTERPLTNDCEVVFFEIPGDRQLHVNVTHKYATKAVAGWAGPGIVPSGFVYNRRFPDTQKGHVMRHIREMVFAGRI
jgi:hypothetical protein